MIKRLVDWFIRIPCSVCEFYIEENNTCQSKKCGSTNPYITRADRLFCEPYKKRGDSRCQ